MQTLLQYSCSAVVHYLIASTPLPTASTLCGTILGPNYCLLRPSHLDCDCLSLLASLCALPSSLLGADPFLHHPALLGPNHCLLSCILSLLSSIFFLRDRSFLYHPAILGSNHCILRSPFLSWSCLSLLSSLVSLLSLVCC